MPTPYTPWYEDVVLAGISLIQQKSKACNDTEIMAQCVKAVDHEEPRIFVTMTLLALFSGATYVLLPT